jgi:hypothetical protein
MSLASPVVLAIPIVETLYVYTSCVGSGSLTNKPFELT